VGFTFGHLSAARLQECHERLRLVAYRALERSPCDFSVLCGHRSQVEQDAAFASGRSQLPWPTGNHNALPSLAFDFAPHPMPFSAEPKHLARFYLIAGVCWAVAAELGIVIRWGGDWDSDGDLTDQSFDDLGHVELVPVTED
jgi:hypothetical protein